MLLHQHHALVRLHWQKVRGMCRTQGQGTGVKLTHQLSCHSPPDAQRHTDLNYHRAYFHSQNVASQHRHMQAV